MRLFPIRVRWRLAWWYALSLALIFSVFSGALYVAVRASCLQPIRAQLDNDFAAIEKALHRQPADLVALEASIPYFRILEKDRTVYVTHGWAVTHICATPGKGGDVMGQSGDGRHYYIREATIVDSARTLQLAVGIDIEQSYHSLMQLERALLFGFPVVLLASLGGGYLFAGRVLAPVDAMASKAWKITAERLSERLPVGDVHDEFGHLASAFNDVFRRLEASFDNMRRFTADASHELRTPLTILRSVGENALRQRQAPAWYEEAIGSMLEEADRLTQLLDDLLMLARVDAGQYAVRTEDLDLAELALDTVNCLRILAEEKSQNLECNADGGVMVRADSRLIRQALLNLVANAVRYSPEHGRIRVCVRRMADNAGAIEVHDNGPGIAEQHRHRIFERFYRIKSDRSKDSGGTGLGLAIARVAVELNGGRIELESEEKLGSVFRIILPGQA